MNTSDTTILITGGGSGIGRALAEQFHQRGSKVIIAGRRLAMLEETTRANPGMAAVALDIENPAAIRSFAEKLTRDFPALNAVIHNAGIMKFEDLLTQAGDVGIAEATIATNLLGPIRLNSALLPHLLKQSHATIITVTSGLAFVPMFPTPTYCATKAALHSWTQSLRFQLRDTAVEVLELAPPWVQTELMGETNATDPRAMPLDEFIAEVMQLLETTPTPTEILVGRVKPLRFAEKSGDYDAFYRKFNESMASHE
ncbi:MAG: SDR family NAD(P)-dependent oxidoreductase [Opitutus sp.]